MTVTRKESIRKFISTLLFPFIVLSLFITGNCFIKEDDGYIIDFENRISYRFPKPLFHREGWLSGDYQQYMNLALADQLPFATTIRQKYFMLTNGILFREQKHLYNFTDYYVHFRNNIYLYGDKDKPYMMLMYQTMIYDKELTDSIVNKINTLARENPQCAFYVYYTKREKDIRFDNRLRTGRYEYLAANLQIPNDHKACMKLESFEDFKKYFYRTDHHWKHTGSYHGYTEIFHLLGLDTQRETLIECGEPILVSTTHHGSKDRNAASGDLFHEDFYAYNYPFATMDITVEGGKQNFYGKETEYFQNQDPSKAYNITYEGVYGENYGEIVFDTHRTDRPNILIIGDSFDNAILKLIAGHYHQTYSIDLRYYEKSMGQKFSLDNYIKEHNITTVLFIGGTAIWASSSFLVF